LKRTGIELTDPDDSDFGRRLGELVSDVAKGDFPMERPDLLIPVVSSLDPALLVIGSDVATGTDGSIELLCLDVSGNVVVIQRRLRETAEQTVAAVLDHLAWAASLSSDDLALIAQTYLRAGTLEESFRRRFGLEVPERLNSAPRALILASHGDASLQRIVTYLAQHGAHVQVLAFRTFSERDGSHSVITNRLVEPPPSEPRDNAPGAAAAGEARQSQGKATDRLAAGGNADPTQGPKDESGRPDSAGSAAPPTSRSFDVAIAQIMRLRSRAADAARAEASHYDAVLLDPTSIVRAFDCLALRRDWVLRAVLVGDTSGHSACTFALPRGEMPALDEQIASLSPRPDPPHIVDRVPYLLPPNWTLRFMQAIEGDGSPRSYLCASLLLRELTDFAVDWHDYLTHDWSAHLILPGWPPPTRAEMEGRPARAPTVFLRDEDWQPDGEAAAPWWERLTWSGPHPEPPEVRMSEREVVVEFCTYRPPFYDPEEVWRHIDTYRVGSYDPLTVKTKVASGKSGRRFLI
jgi:hypothetical protein